MVSVNIQEKIRSIGESVGGTFKRPDKAKLEEYEKALWNSEEALGYLHFRGLTKETIAHFRLGYCEKHHSIAIPVFKEGELINIKYRLLAPDGPRYMGEPKPENWMFNEDGLKWAEKKGAILIVEGEIDCMSVWESGIKNVISMTAGVQSYGPWINYLKKIPKIYIGLDADPAGKSTAKEIAKILGEERCYEIDYKEFKDANEYITKNGVDRFRVLLSGAVPFVRQDFKTVGDIIEYMKGDEGAVFETPFIPEVKFKGGWMAILSGHSNTGKTTAILNIANQLSKEGIGCLIMPFERGIESVGARFLQIMKGKSEQDFKMYTETDWDTLKHEAAQLPLYFAMPSREEVPEFITKAKSYFGIKVIIVDHLDYLVRQVGQNRGDAISDTLQKLKFAAEEAGVVLIIVSHIRKVNAPGEFLSKSKKPGIEDLKGSSSIYQDPEVVVMLYEEEGNIVSRVLKNKGAMSMATFAFNRETGILTPLSVPSTSLKAPESLRLNVNERYDGEDWFENLEAKF